MLKLLSYNVLEGALPDRLAGVLRVIESADADVVAIQEARYWRRSRREVFRNVAKRLGLRGVLVRANSGFDLAVFSRLPILSHANLGLDTAFMHTTARLEVRAPSRQTFFLFVTHLRYEYEYRPREVRLLLEWMRPYRRELCAVCGDLNSLSAGDYVSKRLIWPDSALVRRPLQTISAVERAGWVDCFRLRNPAAPGLTLGAGRRAARVDYILASKPLARRVRACRVLHHPEARAASDHSPIWAEFDI